MFAVIQEVETKKPSKGNAKSLELYESCFTVNGTECCYYRYRKSDDRFERPIRKAYRISVRESFRKDGKVRQKQVSICTIRYYDVVDFGDWIGDYVRGNLKAKADILGITEEELTDMVYEKWQPVVDRIKAEYEQTEEYAASQEHRRIIKAWTEKREAFAKEYGADQNEYDRCYDVFGTLRNPEYLKKVKSDYEARKRYEEKRWEYRRSYQEHFHSNHNSDGSGSYAGISSGNYTSDDKAILKQFYRVLSKKFHPDANLGTDTSKEMKLLNQLKNEWGV